jgi:hypothetical protein
MTNKHIHTFDSRYGYVAGRMGLALACKCGTWALPAGGEWQAVPVELLPRACALRTRSRRIARHLRAYAIALGIGLALAWWLS